MREHHSLLAWALAALFLLSVSACKTAPRSLDAHAQTTVDMLLVDYETKDELSGFVGAHPLSCIPSSYTTEICEWQAGDRQAGWREMARAIGTRDRINLICEVHTSGQFRAAGSCTVHPRRSNKYAWETGGRRTGKGAKTAAELKKIKARNQGTANQWMANADTLLEMSRLMGAIPDECISRSENEQYCLWRTSNYTFGHGVLVVWIDAARSKKIRLRCLLPKDGGKRAADSCYAEVGA